MTDDWTVNSVTTLSAMRVAIASTSRLSVSEPASRASSSASRRRCSVSR